MRLPMERHNLRDGDVLAIVSTDLGVTSEKYLIFNRDKSNSRKKRIFIIFVE